MLVAPPSGKATRQPSPPPSSDTSGSTGTTGGASGVGASSDNNVNGATRASVEGSDESRPRGEMASFPPNEGGAD